MPNLNVKGYASIKNLDSAIKRVNSGTPEEQKKKLANFCRRMGVTIETRAQ